MQLMMAISNNWKIFSLLFWVLMFSGCKNVDPKIEAGFLDLSGWDFRTQSIDLNGEWEFYWKRLLTPADFKDDINLKCDYITVPRAWKGYRLNQKSLGPYGYATYRVRIKALPGRYALCTKKIETAFSIWVNGRKISSVGVVGKDRQSAKPQYSNALEFFWVKEDHIEIIIQVSNFRHFQSGIVRNITLGNHNLIHSQVLNRRTLNFSIASTFLVAAMYNLIIFMQRRKNKTALFIAVFYLCFSAYISILLEHLLIQLFPNFNWELHFKILYFTFLYAPILYLLYLKALFPDYTNRKVVKILWVSTTVVALIILITKSEVSNNITGILYLLLILSILYCCYILFLAFKDKQKGALAQSIPCFALFITAVNDTLYSSGAIDTTRLVPTGVLFFVIWQFCFMADAFAKSLNRSESLSENLAQANVKFASLLEECDVEVGKILANLNQITHIKSNGHYCLIFRNGATRPIELNMQIGKIPTSIRNTRFLDVHRSYLMNLDKVNQIVKVADNKYEAIVKGTEDRIPVSRNKVSGLRKRYPNLFN
jgi:hypothetical protein